MAVPKFKRGESNKGFYYDTVKICIQIVQFVLKDFGIKGCMRDLKAFTYKAKMNNQDKEDFIHFCNKYNIDVEASYPMYVLDHYRQTILNIINDILYDLLAAYSINPNSIAEIQIKNKLQHELIGKIEYLIITLDFVIRLFNYKAIDIEKYSYYIKKLKEVSKKIKSWKRNSLRSTKDIESKELVTNLTNAQKGYNFVTNIVTAELNAVGINTDNIKNVDINEIVNKCIKDKKNSKNSSKKTDSLETNNLNSLIGVDATQEEIIIPDFSENSSKIDFEKSMQLLKEDNHKLVKDKNYNIYYDYSDMLDLGNGIMIPNCLYNENFEPKITI